MYLGGLIRGISSLADLDADLSFPEGSIGLWKCSHDPPFETIQFAIFPLNNLKHHTPFCFVLADLPHQFLKLFRLPHQLSLKHFNPCFPSIPIPITSPLLLVLPAARVLNDLIEAGPGCTDEMGNLLLYLHHHYFFDRPVHIDGLYVHFFFVPLPALEVGEDMIGVDNHFSVPMGQLQLFLILPNGPLLLLQQLLHLALLTLIPCLPLLQPLNFPPKSLRIILLLASL